MTLSPPSPTSTTHTQFNHLLSLYASVLKRVYEGKIKDGKKLAQALDDEAWRYEGLVKQVKGRKGKDDKTGGWLEKAELERLVRWKITHGTNRPFLPAQVRKNEPSAVKSATSAGFNKHTAVTAASPPKDPADLRLPREALDSLATLTGVGPATATLLLSVHDPVGVPFFQDELYHWLCGTETKLKYTMKEYGGLFEKVRELRSRLGNAVTAEEVEKVGFVVGHLDGLEDGEREKLESVLRGTTATEDAAKKARAGAEKEEEPEKVPGAKLETFESGKTKVKGERKAPGKRENTTEHTGKKRKSLATEIPGPTRKSQRAR